MRYSIQLGDWSGDGHGISETVYVEIPDNFAVEQIAENYAKNVARLGFGYHKIANEYEDSTILATQVETLEKAGLHFVKAQYDDATAAALLAHTVENNNHVVLEVEEPDYDESKYSFFSSDYDYAGFVRIIMFMLGDGLPGFVWDRVTIDARPLIGAGSPISNKFAGYGFFGN